MVWYLQFLCNQPDSSLLFYIFDVKRFCPWLTVFAAWENFFLQKQLWSDSVEVNYKQPVIPVCYFGNVIDLHSFLNVMNLSLDGDKFCL